MRRVIQYGSAVITQYTLWGGLLQPQFLWFIRCRQCVSVFAVDISFGRVPIPTNFLIRPISLQLGRAHPIVSLREPRCLWLCSLYSGRYGRAAGGSGGGLSDACEHSICRDPPLA